MRFAPLVPKPDPTRPAKRTPRRPPFSRSYVVPKVPLPWESTFSDPIVARGGQDLSSEILPKLEVGDVNDPLEREADAIADHVMRMPAPSREAVAGPAADTELDEDLKDEGEDEDEDLSKVPTLGAFAGAAVLGGGPKSIAQRKCGPRSAQEAIRRACTSCAREGDEKIQREPDPALFAPRPSKDFIVPSWSSKRGLIS